MVKCPECGNSYTKGYVHGRNASAEICDAQVQKFQVLIRNIVEMAEHGATAGLTAGEVSSEIYNLVRKELEWPDTRQKV